MRFASLLPALGLTGLAWAAKKDKEESPDGEDVKSIALRTHTLVQPYLDSDMQSRWYDFGGDTIIRTDSYIRVASNRPSQAGWLFSRVPLTATNWAVEVEFKITGNNQLFGDGMAMWVTKERGQPGPVFGHTDMFNGLGIFIDTYKNNRPGVIFPYVSAMFGDGNTRYDKNNDGKLTEIAGCSARGLRNAAIPTKLKLTYFQDKSLKLELQYKTEDEWIVCFETNDPPAIPQIAYLGFSAETGELSDNHDIISVRARNLYISGKSKSGSSTNEGSKSTSKKSRKAKGEQGSWFWFLVKIMLVMAVLGGAYVGFTIYRTSKKSHRF